MGHLVDQVRLSLYVCLVTNKASFKILCDFTFYLVVIVFVVSGTLSKRLLSMPGNSVNVKCQSI